MSGTLTTQAAGIFGGGSFSYGFLHVTAGSYNAYFPVHAASDSAGNLIDPATEESLVAIKTAVQGNLSVSWQGQTVTANLGTIAGVATATNQAAGNATLASILATLQTQRAETLWTDDTGAYYVRIDNAGTISWTDLSGNAASAPGTGARPASGTSTIVDRSSYQATAAATGYSVGDLLDHIVTTDPSTGVVLGHFWLNVTTEAKLASAPSSANITPLSPLPTGAATASGQASALTAANTIGTNTAAIGATGDLATATTLVGLAKAQLAKLGAIVIAAGTAVIGKVGIQVNGSDVSPANPVPVAPAGSVGADYSANKPTLPNVGANFAASGAYASYVLVATVAANPARLNIDIENISGAQIAVVRDDGTAASGAAPANASVFALGGGSGAGAQGGAWSSQTFRGRLQIYALSASAVVAVMQD